jgi:2-C-methyl-D-erythritol 4-phosphate cytidylyltransferase
MSDSIGAAKNWVVIPAAGIGKRMGATVPKQYLQLNGKTVLDQTLERLLAHPLIDGVIVAIASHDCWWQDSTFFSHPAVRLATGGAERCNTVFNAMQQLLHFAAKEDYVLVHDAARPCVRHADISRLIQSVHDYPEGGLLGMPVRDTMKRTDENGNIRHTEDRDGLWHAFTPQMFRIGQLYEALEKALGNNQLVTDDASAMELAGFSPLMIEGAPDNIKITRPEDLALAAYYLAQQSMNKSI